MRASTAHRLWRAPPMTKTNLSTAPIPSESQKPTVLLAGWLGSQPSKLRRYREFYESRGYPTITRIATPGMVVAAARPNALGPRVPVKPSELPWTSKARGIDSEEGNGAHLRTMQDLAWETLRALHRHPTESPESESASSSSLPRRFVMHSFSNGGCFLYEQIQRILSTREDQPDEFVATSLQQLEMVGGVFDSCPALDLSLLDGALSYCTPEELEELDALHPNYRTEARTHLDDRQEEFHRFMLETRPGLPQLYIYSRTDPLVPFGPLDALVEGRVRNLRRLQAQGGLLPHPSYAPPVVHKLVLDDSPHCAHYLHHREAYEAALDSFLAPLVASEEGRSAEGQGRRARL